MKAEIPLDARILRIRRSIRSRHPLDERIALVRNRHRAFRKSEAATPSLPQRAS